MQPQDPNNDATSYSQPVNTQSVIAQNPVPNSEQSQPNYPVATSQASTFPATIGVGLGSIGLIIFAILLGYVDGGSNYLSLLIPLAVSLIGSLFCLRAVSTDGRINKLALVGLMVGLATVCLSLSFTIGQGIVTHKIKAAESAVQPN